MLGFNRIIAVLVAGISVSALAQQPENKLPIPNDAAQKQAASLIANLFKADYDAAKTPEQRSALAKKMLQVGIDSKDDATGRYVLLRIARDIAADAGDVTTAIAAVKSLAEYYEVDVLAMDTDALGKLVKAITLPKDHQELASILQSVFVGAIARDRFDIARRINAIALESARQARSADLVKRVVAASKEIESLEVEFQKVQSASKSLTSSPTDPEANLLVGKYRCFVKGDWDNGLLMLALGSDPNLKTLAESEMAEKPDALELGHAWWDYSESVEEKANTAARVRAAMWYMQALPGLEGLSKKLVESRMAEVRDSIPSFPSIDTSSKVISVHYSDPKGFGGVGLLKENARLAIGRDYQFQSVPDEIRGLHLLMPVADVNTEITLDVPGGTDLWLFVIDIDKASHQAEIKSLVPEGWKDAGKVPVRIGKSAPQYYLAFHREFPKSNKVKFTSGRFTWLMNIASSKRFEVIEEKESPAGSTQKSTKTSQLREKFAPDAVEFNGRYYKVVVSQQKGITWTDAAKACEAAGGRLACLETQELQNKAYEWKGNLFVWIGAYRDPEKGRLWVNGKPATWWYNGKADDPSKGGISKGMYTFLWDTKSYGAGTAYNDGSRNKEKRVTIQGFICEWEE